MIGRNDGNADVSAARTAYIVMTRASRIAPRLCLLGFFFLVCTSCASIPTSFEPPPPCGRSDLPQRPELVSGRLGNGLRYVIWPLPGQREVSLRLVVDAGSFHEADKERGLAHFLEHMAFRGSENFPGGARVTELEALGIGWGAHNNAITGYEHTWYKLDLPNATEETFDRGLFVLRETADHLTLPADALETERGVVLAEMRLRDTAGSRYGEAALEMIYADWLTNIRPTGSADVIRQVSRDDMARFYRRWYRPQRMTIVAAGGIDPTVAARLIRARFGDMTNSTDDPPPHTPSPVFVARGNAVRLVPERGNNINVMLLTAEPIDCFLDGYRERETTITLRVAYSILARRLTERARAENASFSVSDVSSDIVLRRARIGEIDLTTTPAHWREAVAAAEQEMRRALTFGFTDQEIATAKATFKSNLHQWIASDAAKKPPTQADTFVYSIIFGETVEALEPTVAHLEKTLDALDGASVKAALQALWADGDRRWLLGGTFESDVTEATVRDAVRASELTVVTAPQQKEDKPFAYESFGAPGVIAHRRNVRRSLTVATFENRVRVAALNTEGGTSTKVQVGIDLFDCGRLFEPAGLDGLSYLAGRYFLSGGLAAHSGTDVSQRLEQQGISVYFDIGRTRCQFTASAPRAALPFTLRVMAAHLMAPGFREDAFASLQNGIIDREAAAIESSASSVLVYPLSRRRCAGDARCGFPDVAMLKARRLEEVKAWLGPTLRDAPLIVSISASGDVEAILNEVAATLGALPPRSPVPAEQPPVADLPTPPPGAIQTLEYRSADNIAYALVEFPVANMRDYARWIKQELLARLIGERVRNDLRLATGASYAVDATQESVHGVTPHWLQIRADTSPEKARDAARRIVAIVAAVAEHPFTQAELSRAAPVVRRLLGERWNNPVLKLGVWRGEVRPGVWLNDVNRTAKLIDDVSLNEVNTLAKDLLRLEQARTYLVMPSTVSAKSRE